MKQKYFWIIIALAFLLLLGIYTTNNKNKESTVSWDEAMRILNSGQVQRIMQTHNLEVIFTLQNGRIIHTKEHEIDEIFDEIEKCGNSCKYVSEIATQ